jgi:hypothetical protein
MLGGSGVQICRRVGAFADPAFEHIGEQLLEEHPGRSERESSINGSIPTAHG